MAPLRREELARLCRQSDDETVVGFAAALYEARGYTVTDTDSRGFTIDTAAGAERIALPGADGEHVDTLVVAGRDPPEDTGDSVDRLDAAQLWEWLRYAVDSETADSLCRAWLDRPFESGDRGAESEGEEPTDDSAGEADEEDGTGSDETGDGGPGRRGERAARAGSVEGVVEHLLAALRNAGPNGGMRYGAAAGLAVLLLIGVAAWTVSGGVGSEGTPAIEDGTPTAAEETPAGTPVAAVSIPRPRTATATPTAGRTAGAVFPPGMNASGITDADRLANAHEARLGGQSYRATISYHEFEDGDAVGTVVQTVRVVNRTRYRGTRTEIGDVDGVSPTLTVGDVYANGSARFVRTESGVRRESLSAEEPYIDRVEQYHRWYLSVEESTITNRTTVEGRPAVQVRIDGDPWPGVRSTTGSAVVTETGIVTLVHRSYIDPDTGRRVVVTVRVSDVGSVSVSPPPWLP
ncbi:MAG: hypothetical protein ABEH35_02750 [Haloarculaceae archaeon]